MLNGAMLSSTFTSVVLNTTQQKTKRELMIFLKKTFACPVALCNNHNVNTKNFPWMSGQASLTVIEIILINIWPKYLC